MVQIQVDTMEMLGFNIVLLIASIPIALRVVCVSTLAFGCRELAAEGAIVSRLNAIEELAGMWTSFALPNQKAALAST